jgi:drug/metabolite transporter (DMT)-like permease
MRRAVAERATARAGGQIAGALAALLPVGAMAAVNIIWGAAFPITKPALDDIPPFTFAVLRFLVALAILLPLAGRRWVDLLRGPERGRIIALGMFGFCLVQLSQMAALRLSPSSDIALISTLTPLWITLLAWPMLGERPTRLGWAGFGLAIAGLALIVWPSGGGDASPLQRDRLMGDAIYLVGALVWALYNIIGKGVMERHDPIGPTAAACLVGTVGLIPFSIWEVASGQQVRLTAPGALALLYVALLVTVVGFLVLFWAYTRLSAAQVAITMYLQPLAGVLVAWLWLREPLSAGFVVGAALVLAGVGCVTLIGAPGRRPAPSGERSG